MKYKAEITPLIESYNMRVFDETGRALTTAQVVHLLNRLEALEKEIETVKNQRDILRKAKREIFNLFDDVRCEFDGTEHQQGKKDGLRLALSFLYPDGGWEQFNVGESRGRARIKLSGAARIAKERRRQLEEEVFTAEHDDKWVCNELLKAATSYAGFSTSPEWAKQGWPWAADWFKPGTHLRNLVKAGALIAAEIDRLQRKED